MIFTSMILFAQATGTAAPAGGAAAAPSADGGMFQMLLFLFVLFGIMWFLMIRPQQREQKRRQTMWDSVQKFDKIVTIDGIHGTVTAIDKEAGTLTLLIDEGNNTKIRIWTSCVGEVLPAKDEKEAK